MVTKKHSSTRKFASRKPAKGSAAETYKQYLKVRRMPAAFSKETAEQMESAFAANNSGSKGFGPYRRSLLTALTLPAKELIDTIKRDRKTAEAFADVYVCGWEYLQHLNRVIETLKAAQVRIMVGLCTREDMAEIIAAAENEGKATEAA